MGMNSKADPVILDGTVLHTTTGAVLFNFGGAAGKEVWLPKSQLRYCSTYEIGETAEIEIPYWLAENKGLV